MDKSTNTLTTSSKSKYLYIAGSISSCAIIGGYCILYANPVGIVGTVVLFSGIGGGVNTIL